MLGSITNKICITACLLQAAGCSRLLCTAQLHLHHLLRCFFNMKSYFVSINLRKHCTVAYCSQEVYKYFVLPWYFVDAIYSFMEIILPLMSQPTTQSIFPTFSFRRLILLLSYTFAENCYFLRKITLLTMANS